MSPGNRGFDGPVGADLDPAPNPAVRDPSVVYYRELDFTRRTRSADFVEAFVREDGVIVGWNGQRIQGAWSPGGVFAALDWRDLVLVPGDAISSKARVASAHLRDFSEEDQKRLTARDGRYSDVQSIRSEDTVTWSVFAVDALDGWAPVLLEGAFGRREYPGRWHRVLWRRLPHPETEKIDHGPEPDVLLEGEGVWCLAVEAKWLSDFGARQGQGGTTTQLEMRAASVAKRAVPDRRGVLVVAPSPGCYPPAQKAGSTFLRHFVPEGAGYRARPEAELLQAQAVTWERIAELITERQPDSEVARYLRWRLDLL